MARPILAQARCHVDVDCLRSRADGGQSRLESPSAPVDARQRTIGDFFGSGDHRHPLGCHPTGAEGRACVDGAECRRQLRPSGSDRPASALGSASAQTRPITWVDEPPHPRFNVTPLSTRKSAGDSHSNVILGRGAARHHLPSLPAGRALEASLLAGTAAVSRQPLVTIFTILGDNRSFRLSDRQATIR